MSDTKQKNKNIDDIHEIQQEFENSEISPPAESSLDKVRDILFGEQVRENQKEFSFLKTQQEALFLELNNELNARFDQLANDIAQIRKELGQEAADHTAIYNRKMDEIDNELGELRTGSTNLNLQMENWREELSTELDLVNSQLSNTMTSRASLAELLEQMSIQLMKD